MRPRDRRRLQHLCWLVLCLTCSAGLFLGLSGGSTGVHMLYDEVLEPARPYWSSEQLGVVPFALPGERTAEAHLITQARTSQTAKWPDAAATQRTAARSVRLVCRGAHQRRACPAAHLPESRALQRHHHAEGRRLGGAHGRSVLPRPAPRVRARTANANVAALCTNAVCRTRPHFCIASSGIASGPEKVGRA